MNLPLEVDVSSRDCFIHTVFVDKANVNLEWSFGTKKKSIGFGLFYSTQNSTQDIAEIKTWTAVAENRSASSSTVKPNETGAATKAPSSQRSSEYSRSQDVLNSSGGSGTGSGSGSKSKLPGFLGKLPSSIQRSFTSSSMRTSTTADSSSASSDMVVGEKPRAAASSNSGASSVDAPSAAEFPIRATIRRSTLTTASNRPDLPSSLHPTAAAVAGGSPPDVRQRKVSTGDAFQVSGISTVDESASGKPASLQTIIPLERHHAASLSVQGSYRVLNPGYYIFVFDNSFSRTTSKHLTFYVTITEPDKAADTEKSQETQGWMLKKKRRNRQGWAKRWVCLKGGIVSYYSRPNSECRGSISVTSAAISVITDQRLIVIDSGSMIYYFRCLTEQDLNAWVEAIRAHRAKFPQFNAEEEEDGGEEADSDSKADSPTESKYALVVNSPMSRRKSLATTTVLQSASSLHPGGRWMLSEYADINENLHATEDEMEEIKIRFRKLSTTVERSLAEQMEDVFARLERIHSTLAACTVRLMSGPPPSHAGISRTVPSASSRDSARHRKLGRHSHHPSQTPSISSVYFDAEGDEGDGMYVRSTRAFSGDSGDILFAEGEKINQSVTEEPVQVGSDHSNDSDEEEPQEDVQDQKQEELQQLGSQSVPSNVAPTTTTVTRRKALPVNMSETNVSVMGLLRKNIGKDLSTISMPVVLNEPLNTLQRLCEELEYRQLLVHASECKSSLDRMKWIAGFAVSGYSFSASRTRKPFNPMLGETFEYQDGTLRFISEKVHHNPHIMACHAETDHFTFDQTIQQSSKFWGKSIDLTPIGMVRVHLKKYGETYTWNKANTHVSVMGSNSVEYYGDVKIKNHQTGETCVITFKECGFFNTNKNQITGSIFDARSNQVFSLSGTWSEALYCEMADNKLEVIWRCNPLPSIAPMQYGFTLFAMALNELHADLAKSLPKTDTRLRPDQRMLENGQIDSAEVEKVRLENKQREARKKMQSDGKVWSPQYFTLTQDSETGKDLYVFRNNYWDSEKSNVDLWA